MTLTQDSLLSLVEADEMKKIKGLWTIRERNSSGLVVAERRFKNIWTNFGLTALASAVSGAYNPPIYLSIEAFYTTLTMPLNPGVSQVITNARVDLAGDTQLVLSAGAPTQEVVTFASVSGSGPYTYVLSSPTVQTHATSDYVVRNVAVTDTLSSIQSEVAYDPINAAGQRIVSPGGYSSGLASWTIQFYLPGSISQQLFLTCGLADSPNIGQGNLHNHFILGYNRNGSTNDIEIDGVLTISN